MSIAEASGDEPAVSLSRDYLSSLWLRTAAIPQDPGARLQATVTILDTDSWLDLRNIEDVT